MITPEMKRYKSMLIALLQSQLKIEKARQFGLDNDAYVGNDMASRLLAHSTACVIEEIESQLNQLKDKS